MAASTGTKAPVGPAIWKREPPSAETSAPAMIAVHNPCCGETPDAMANPRAHSRSNSKWPAEKRMKPRRRLSLSFRRESISLRKRIFSEGLAKKCELHGPRNGGREFTLIPCLNEHPAWIAALANMVGEF